MQQSETLANPWHQEEVKWTEINVCKINKINAWKAHRPALSSASEVTALLKRTKNHENKEQGKNEHETPQSHTKYEFHQDYCLRSVGSINHRGFKALLLSPICTLGPDAILNIKVHKTFGQPELKKTLAEPRGKAKK